jgi:hypothetical protein
MSDKQAAATCSLNLAQIWDQWWEIPGAAMQIPAFQKEF